MYKMCSVRYLILRSLPVIICVTYLCFVLVIMMILEKFRLSMVSLLLLLSLMDQPFITPGRPNIVILRRISMMNKFVAFVTKHLSALCFFVARHCRDIFGCCEECEEYEES